MKNWAFFILLLFVVGLLWAFTFNDTLLGLIVPSDYPISKFYERVELFKSFVQVIAIFVAGLWTYQLYIKNRLDYPFPEIQHKVEHFLLEIPDGGSLIYLSVFVTVTNRGKAKLDLRRFEIYVRQVLPLPDEMAKILPKLIIEKPTEVRKGILPELFVDSGQRISWQNLGYRNWKDFPRKMRELEPGQTKDYQFDFIIDADVRVIDVISYINPEEKWGLSTLHVLEQIEPKKHTRRSS